MNPDDEKENNVVKIGDDVFKTWTVGREQIKMICDYMDKVKGTDNDIYDSPTRKMMNKLMQNAAMKEVLGDKLNDEEADKFIEDGAGKPLPLGGG